MKKRCEIIENNMGKRGKGEWEGSRVFDLEKRKKRGGKKAKKRKCKKEKKEERKKRGRKQGKKDKRKELVRIRLNGYLTKYSVFCDTMLYHNIIR